MHFFCLRSGLIVSVLLLLFGCATPTNTKPSAGWIDLDKINSSIDKTKQLPALLDAAAVPEQAEKSEPRSKDMSEPAEKRNRFLQDVASPEPKSFPKSRAEEGILLNFDNADIYEVIQVIAETLNLNYIIDPQVKGVVNIRSGDKISMEHLYDVFKKILNMNGLDIRSEGEYEYIYVAKKLSSSIIYGAGDTGRLKDTPKLITQIMPVMHISSTEAAKLIEPYLSERGSIYDLANLNTIIITDFETKIVDALVLLARLDISPLSSLKVRLIKVENAPLFDLRDELVEILTALKINMKDFEGVSIIPLERVNSLLMMGNSDELLDSADKWVRELDVVPTTGRDNIYIYNVRNSVASDLEALVSSLISDEGGGTARHKSQTTAAPMPSAQASTTSPKSTPTTKSRSTPSKATGSTLHFTGEPVLLADDDRNVILIRALPSDYARILKLLERLDNLPRQVLIEVVIAEVSLTDAWQLGIEWTLKNKVNINNNDYTSLTETAWADFPSGTGLTLSLLNSADEMRALLNTVASDNHLNVLSSPHLLVLNNETASINVGQEVPIVTSQTVSPDSTVSDVQNIQYRDTGVILTVTPRINYDGIIILEVEQQVSTVAQQTTTVGINSPTINNRTLKTKLAVKDGQPILMGGLISTEKDEVDTGVPGIKDVPLLGWLFKYQSETTTKRELILLITPYVIDSEDVLDQYIREFDKKMTELREELRKISAMKHSIE